jgi:RNA polymerase sigma factor (sigma-70 family)
MDDPAYTNFYDFMQANQPPLTGLATKLVHDRLAAEELVSKLFVTFWERLGRPNPPSPSKYRPFANKMLYHLCMKWLRQRGEEQKKFIYIDHPTLGSNGSAPRSAQGIIDDEAARKFFDDRAEARHRAEAIRLMALALKQLSREDRWLFTKRHLQNWTFREIAEARGICISWASARCDRVFLDVTRLCKEAAQRQKD